MRTFKELMQVSNAWQKAWWGRRGDHVKAWWQANPEKRGLAVFSLVLMIALATMSTIVVVKDSTYERTFRYYTNYTDQTSIATASISIPISTYNDYKSWDHSVVLGNISSYERFCNGDSMWLLAMQIKDQLGYGASDEHVIAAILSFVQDKFDGEGGIHYMYDPPGKDYPKFPLETLVDGGGDCEDQAILFTSLVTSIGFHALLIMIPGHIYAAVALTSPPSPTNGTVYHLDADGTRYYTCECTSYGFYPGVILDIEALPCTYAKVTI